MATYVRLFGTPAVKHGGGTIALRPERRHQLAAWLALRATPVARDQLAALFWPDRDNAAARRNLRRLAFDVEGFDWTAGFTGDRATLGWSVATDVADFERALAGGRLDDALALYRGPLCEGLDDAHNNALAEALRFERARLADRWRTAMFAALDRATDASGQLTLAQKLLAADALDEEALAAALRALAQLGRTGEAQRLYRDLKERLAETLGIEPSARLRELVRGLDAGREPTAAVAAPSADFVGRAAELAELQALAARDECRLLTITGPGGIGKSRLAKAALPPLEARFADGIGWIPLDDLTDVAQVAPRIAQLLGIDLANRANALDAVTAFLASGQMLLVLDNSEQIAGLSAWCERLLAAAPRLKLLATSRHRLQVGGEWLLPLPGLAVPPESAPGAAAGEFDAVRLFALRARAAHPPFDPTREAEAVARLVRALGGLPLAIELAAHWVRLLPVAEIEAEVANSLDVLARDEEGDERPEHRSVRATFEQSWRWLSPAEQQALAPLSVFVGSFSRAAASAVADAPLAVLASLVDKSLVWPRADGRFELHPLIRQFGRERLAASESPERAARRHAQWLHRLFARHRDDVRRGERAVLEELESELENFRAAWRWAVAAPAPELLAASASALMHFAQLRVRIAEGTGLLRAAAAVLVPERAADRRAASEVLRALAALQFRSGALDDAAASARRALKAARLLADGAAVKGCLNVIGSVLWQRGQMTQARRYFEQALAQARADGDAHGIATFLGNLGLVHMQSGDHTAAGALFAETLAGAGAESQPQLRFGPVPRLRDL
jgi:predicted ATPase